MTVQEMKAKVVVFSPVGKTRMTTGNNVIAKRLGEIDGKSIGFLDDGQVEGRLLEYVERVLRERYKTQNTFYWRKPDRSKQASQQMLEDIINKCDAVIIGVCA